MKVSEVISEAIPCWKILPHGHRFDYLPQKLAAAYSEEVRDPESLSTQKLLKTLEEIVKATGYALTGTQKILKNCVSLSAKVRAGQFRKFLYLQFLPSLMNIKRQTTITPLTAFLTRRLKTHPFITALSLLLFLAACSDNDETKAPEPQRKRIEKINFFMETSGSMAGYLHGSTEFRKNIPNLLVNIEGKIDSGKLKLQTYYINDSIVRYPGTTQDFITAISTKQPARGKSSEMHKIFTMIANHTDSNDISMFVSDCILSYPDEVLRQPGNENINRDNAEGELKATMTAAFINLKKKNNICASVYGFNSGFVGTYYTFQNQKIPLKGNVQRPYYIWVIGNRDLLINFNKELNELESFRHHTLAMDFGIFENPVTSYQVLFSYQRKGDWSTDYKEVTGIKASDKETAAFAIVTDLSSLPAYARDTAYLRQMVRTSGDNLEFSVSGIELTGGITGAKLKDKERDLVNNGTHVFTFDVKNVFKSGTINLNLPLQYDTTYRRQSIMDDRNVADIAGKTFAFRHLIDGVREAYQLSNQHYIDISIPLKK